MAVAPPSTTTTGSEAWRSIPVMAESTAAAPSRRREVIDCTSAAHSSIVGV